MISQTDRQTDERKRPEISVIVPVYNVAPYLSACLDSVLGQTFRDFELILVEDGSTDGSREIAEKYEAKDTRVRLVERRWNGGLAAARNLGMHVSRGRYVTFLDSDDVAVSEYLEVLYRNALSAQADIVQGGYMELGGQGRRFSWTQKRGLLPNDLQSRVNFFLPVRMHIAPWGKLFRKAFLDEHRMEFYIVPIAEDVSFFYQGLLVAGRYAVIPEILYQYRIREGSLDHAKGATRSERHAVAAARALEGFSRWIEREPAFENPDLRYQLGYVLYRFFRGHFRRFAAEQGRAKTYEIWRKALAGESTKALENMMLYDAMTQEKG